MRLVGVFNDSTVRVISPVTGAVLTTTLLPLKVTANSAAYMSYHGKYTCTCIV